MLIKVYFLIMTILFSLTLKLHAETRSGKYFDRAIFVILENTNYSEAEKQPFLKLLSNNGTHFSNFSAVTHPSQGNYVALTSASLNGVLSDGNYDLQVNNIVDLLESHNLTWKVYAEGYPGNCFTGSKKGKYVRKHNPFISYVNVQKNLDRCKNIVEASQFDQDSTTGTLPNYVFYIPDLDNDGHDTSVSFADKWYKQRFAPYLNNSQFMSNTILITTFDESENLFDKNRIYTSIVGPAVKKINVEDNLNFYSLIKLIEENWELGDLGKNDVNAHPLPNIWL